jgi:signal transduction histidine kinase
VTSKNKLVDTGSVQAFSHDVVSPLMSILALSQVLLLEARPDERLNEDLKRIHAAAEEALALVRSFSMRAAASRRPPSDLRKRDA